MRRKRCLKHAETKSSKRLETTHEKIADLHSMNPGPGTYTAKAVYKNVNSGPKFGNEER